jgi:hypothetical protein
MSNRRFNKQLTEARRESQFLTAKIRMMGKIHQCTFSVMMKEKKVDRQKGKSLLGRRGKAKMKLSCLRLKLALLLIKNL